MRGKMKTKVARKEIKPDKIGGILLYPVSNERTAANSFPLSLAFDAG